MSERYVVKRTDGKLYAGQNSRGAAVFIDSVAGRSSPASGDAQWANRAAEALTYRGHPCAAVPQSQMYADPDFCPACNRPLAPAEAALARRAGNCARCGAGPETVEDA